MTRHSASDFDNAVPVDTGSVAAHGSSSDPKAFLSSLGIDIDSSTEAMLRAKLAAGANGQQAASIVHFDS